MNAQLGIRRSYLAETRRVALEFLKRGLQLIVFAQSRLATEILTTYLKDAFARAARAPRTSSAAIAAATCRAGAARSSAACATGEVRCVVSTNALELGIDIGALDVAVMAGYPGTIAATWQRAGPRRPAHGAIGGGARRDRARRSISSSSAIPTYFFGASPEHALVNPDNLHILLDHVKCAAFELPFRTDEAFGSDRTCRRCCPCCAEEGFVQLADGQWQWTQESYPADAVSLRSVTSDNFVVVDMHRRRARHRRDRLHERPVDAPREGDLHRRGPALSGRAVRLRRAQGVRRGGRVRLLHRRDHVHEGHDSRDVCERPGPGSLRTIGRSAAGVTSRDTCRGTRLSRASGLDASAMLHGEVHVVSRVVGFKKIKFYTNENVGSGELDLPEQQMHTTSYWLTIPAAVMAALPFGGDDRRDGVVGLAYAMRNVAPLLLMCDGHDLGLSIDGVSRSRAPAASAARCVEGRRAECELAVEPTIFLYDNYPGRHRLQRAAVRDARRAARAHARADRRLSV